MRSVCEMLRKGFFPVVAMALAMQSPADARFPSFVSAAPAHIELTQCLNGSFRAQSGCLAVEFDGKTFSPSAYFLDSRNVMVYDPSLPTPVAINDWAPYFRTGAKELMKGVSVEKTDDCTIRSRIEYGQWRIDSFLQFFPEMQAVRRWGEFEWLGFGRRKFSAAVYLALGKIVCREGLGGYIVPGKFPPVSGTGADRREGRTVSAPMSDEGPIFADNGEGMRVTICIDQLQEYSDCGQTTIVERNDGYSFHVRWAGEGYAEKGRPQKAGDVWMILGEGSSEDALLHFHDWHRFVGHVPPSDRPECIKDTILYSTHPKGKQEFAFGDRGGFKAAAKLLPGIKRLGASCIWLRPVEQERPYVPADMYCMQDGVGNEDDCVEYVRVAHDLGLNVWKDAVMHGGMTDNERTKAHPEWVCRKDSVGHPFQRKYWAYDFFWPTWVKYFGDWVEWATRRFELDGWRMDVPTGSPFSNWNTEIPYARASYAQNQGGLAQMRSIRSALKRVNPQGATLAEANRSYCSVLCDAIYDQNLCHAIFHDFCDMEPADVVKELQRWLHEQQYSYVPGTVWLRYPESHDSYMAENVWGRDVCNALMALSAWIKGIPLVYNEGEDGAYESYRRIFAVRKRLGELDAFSDADYQCVTAPDGVFACYRSNGKTASVVLVNFNNCRVMGKVKSPNGDFNIDLPPYGYTVRRVKGKPVSDVCRDVIEAEQNQSSDNGGNKHCLDAVAELRNRHDNSLCTNKWIIAQSDAGEAKLYEVKDFAGANPRDVRMVLKIQGVDHWFAHSAEGSFESPFVVRHRDVGRIVYRGEDIVGWIRWESARHPLGFVREHAEVGGIAGNQAICFYDFGSGADVELIDRCGDDEGFAVVVKGDTESAFCVKTELMSARSALRRRDPGTGDDRLKCIAGGWIYEDDKIKVRIRRSGTIAGIWSHREDGKWFRALDTMETFYRRTTNQVVRFHWFRRDRDEYNLAYDPYAKVRFLRKPDGCIELMFKNGQLRTFEKNNGDMKTPIRVDTTYRFGGAAKGWFDMSVDCKSERNLGNDDGDFGIRFRFPEEIKAAISAETGMIRSGVASLEISFDGDLRKSFKKIVSADNEIKLLCHESGRSDCLDIEDCHGSLDCRIRVR